MKQYEKRLHLIEEFDRASMDALFTQKTVAALRNCSLATIERDRWAGTGVPFLKIGRSVRYRKSDIVDWLWQHQPVQSTTQADYAKAEKGGQ